MTEEELQINKGLVRCVELLIKKYNYQNDFNPVPLLPSVYDWLKENGMNMMYFSRMTKGRDF